MSQLNFLSIKNYAKTNKLIREQVLFFYRKTFLTHRNKFQEEKTLQNFV